MLTPIAPRTLRAGCQICITSTDGRLVSARQCPKFRLQALARDVCAICGEKLCGDEVEKQVKLPCDHEFHEFCIRGWSIIGKKETCPYCNEKVDLKKLYPHPWTLSRQDVLFSQLLDALRYLVVWQPVIIVIAKLINHALGLI